MAIKPTKVTRKTPSRKVRDLSARKDPRGGAQKKENPGMTTNARGGVSLRAGKNRLA